MSHWKIARNGGMSWRQGFSRSTFQHGMDRQTGCGRGGQLSRSGFAKIRRTRLFQRTLAKAVPSRDERVNSGGLGRYRCVDGCRVGAGWSRIPFLLAWQSMLGQRKRWARLGCKRRRRIPHRMALGLGVCPAHFGRHGRAVPTVAKRGRIGGTGGVGHVKCMIVEIVGGGRVGGRTACQRHRGTTLLVVQWKRWPVRHDRHRSRRIQTRVRGKARRSQPGGDFGKRWKGRRRTRIAPRALRSPSPIHA